MSLHIGTCSWNYDSWAGLVYTAPQQRAVDYLPEYARKYRMVEVDSWFYRLPSKRDVEEYKAAVDPGFTFIVKAPQDITLTHKRGKAQEPNPAFLSPELFGHFLESIEPIHDQLGAIILEFEYLNKQKMAGRSAFLEQLRNFIQAVPREIPIGIEPRNGSYLDAEWFSFLAEYNLIHVFSEKQYMPPATELYAKYNSLLGSSVIFRLLGGDRASIEEATGQNWNRIVAPQPALPAIAGIVSAMLAQGKEVYVDINNHYEGSAPETIERFLGFLDLNRK